ncbi:MAG: hypothetical protein PHR68_04125, partial [Candidatus Gracilibacteria bacterium]|nr:hypothetical protein [Candidatus Gracilibacteria bacterium]
MKETVSSLLLRANLALGNPNPLNNSVNDISVTSSYKVSNVLEISNIFSNLENELKEYNLSEKELTAIKNVLSDKKFQNKFYEIIKEEKSYKFDEILLILLLFFAGIGGYIYKNNKSNYKNLIKSKTNEDYEKHIARLTDALNLFSFPVVKYSNDGKPEIWNKKMADETGYTHEEVLKYFEENGEVMTLLYKGEDLEIVNKYLKSIENTGEGYEGIAFTMTTKSGEK